MSEVERLCDQIESTSPASGGDIVALILRLGIENNDPERELASALLAALAARRHLLPRDIVLCASRSPFFAGPTVAGL